MSNVVVATPVQQTMVGGGSSVDIFKGQRSIFVRQQIEAVELCGIEAKNKYRISQPGPNATEGNVFMFVHEESECCQRICCGPNRDLTLHLHDGATKEAPVVWKMHKDFHCQGCCCLRPKTQVYNPDGSQIGSVEDPCRCCLMDQHIMDARGTRVFTTEGTMCQLGLCCPICFDVHFDMKNNGNKIGSLTKHSMDLAELCCKVNRFTLDFGSVTDAQTRKLMFGSAMLIDLEYFEQQK